MEQYNYKKTGKQVGDGGAFKSLNAKYRYEAIEIFEETEKLVMCGKKCGGVVFGGYVRDIIIPLNKLKVPLKSLDFKDMDFWFTSEENAEQFVKEAGLKVQKTLYGLSGQENYDDGKYPIKRKQYISKYKGMNFVIIDVVVCNFYPVCDFSVNLLTWDGAKVKVNAPYDVEDVMRQINQGNFDPELCGARKVVKESYYSLEDIIDHISGLKPIDICKPFLRHATENLDSASTDFKIMANCRYNCFGLKMYAKQCRWALRPMADVHSTSDLVKSIKSMTDRLTNKEKHEVIKHIINQIA